jgi:hypothetical protein
MKQSSFTYPFVGIVALTFVDKQLSVDSIAIYSTKHIFENILTSWCAHSVELRVVPFP